MGEITGRWVELTPDVCQVEVLHEAFKIRTPKPRSRRGEARMARRVPAV